MTTKQLDSDRLLHEKMISAWRGMRVYKRLYKKYQTKETTKYQYGNDFRKQLGHNPRQTALIFQPDGYSDDAVYSLTCLNQLILTVNPLRIVIITTNPDMRDYTRLFNVDAEFELITEGTARDILNYALMAELDSNFYIASMTEPYGRWGDKIIKQGMSGAERCFAVGVYRVWQYRQEPLPCYDSLDQRILSFLERADHLQRESIRADLEAQKKYAKSII